ncbi:hypothetical protein H2204_012171 [Knufia peltigerae]|uniref:RRM domain-containing protein n=1 Tax=Knufia peltigerae TaxID=1002370 RepID=A0AA38XSZ2_9EURO|nr:hypothetical protein H2204_012171 [Knufia peltigerae]
MAAEEDNFDIDIYGDGEGEIGNGEHMEYKEENEENLFAMDAENEQHMQADEDVKPKSDPENEQVPAQTSQAHSGPEEATQKPNDTTDKPTPVPQQGVKRKETSDDRPVDHGATNALMISDLNWWTTEDDIRGWTNEAGAEDELRDITFSEHKVNGKSKGQVYVEFSSPQAATAAKHTIEAQGGSQPAARKHSVVFTNATHNPFKSLPKDAPTRTRDDRPVRGGGFSSGARSDNNYGGNQGFRGGRGGNYNRGGYGGHGQYNRNFSGPMGGYNNNNMGFQGNMGMNNNYGGFNRGGMMGGPMRGNMGGMRGGRGGMNPMMAMGGAMGMGNMGMNPMMAGMGMSGFQGNQFNPGMFNAGQAQGFGGGAGGDWNQHGAKRQRQE